MVPIIILYRINPNSNNRKRNHQNHAPIQTHQPKPTPIITTATKFQTHPQIHYPIQSKTMKFQSKHQIITVTATITAIAMITMILVKVAWVV